MSTSFDEIYSYFLNLIEDLNFVQLTDTELKEILYMYLKRSAFLEFKQCKKDLTKITMLDDINGQFDEDLTEEEKIILSLGMVLYWLEPKINKENLLRTALGDRDFKQLSNANQLKELLELEQNTRNKLKEYIINYTYNNFEGFS